MKVKVGTKIYDGNEEPVMVILTDQDKKNIANMLPECDRYCMYPDSGVSKKAVDKFMDKGYIK